MKLYLASYFQPENHGPGRLIGISYGKPKDTDAPYVYRQFVPSADIWFKYKDLAKENQEKASATFEVDYKQQIGNFVNQLTKDAKAQGKSPMEMLPLESGDTLASWEKDGHLTYRLLLAPFLQELGYEVVLR